MVDCREFLGLLDTLGAEALSDEARVHAAGCRACAAALAAAIELDTLLADSNALVAPAGFTESVLARVRAADAAALLAQNTPLDWRQAMPIWARLAFEPAVLLSLVLAAVVAWQIDRLPALALAGVVMMQQAFGSLATASAAAVPASSWLGDPIVRLGLLTTALTLAPFAALTLYRWTERLAGGGHRAS